MVNPADRATTDINDPASAIGAFLQRGIDEGLFPGATFAVTNRERTLWSGAVGHLDAELQRPAQSDSLYDLASLTKPLVTTTSILQLAGEGEFHLGQELRRFLPAVGAGLCGITLREMLTHTSGLPAWHRFHSRGLSREEALAELYAVRRERPRGEKMVYSDLGFLLLGEVVREVSGQSLDEFARERIFGPLGMKHTRFRPSAEIHLRIAETLCPDRGPLLGVVHDGNCNTFGGVSGHAGLFGAAEDVALYARRLLRAHQGEGGPAIAPLAARQMATPQLDPAVVGSTLGWFIRPNGFLPAGDLLPDDTFGHTGFTGTSLLLCPSVELGIILLTNRVRYERNSGDFLQFRRRFHNRVASLWASS